MNEEKRELFNEEVSEEINKAVNKDITGSSGTEANDDRGSQIDEVIAGEPKCSVKKRVEMNAERPANRSVRYCVDYSPKKCVNC